MKKQNQTLVRAASECAEAAERVAKTLRDIAGIYAHPDAPEPSIQAITSVQAITALFREMLDMVELQKSSTPPKTPKPGAAC